MQMFYTVGVVWIFYGQMFYLDADFLNSWCSVDFLWADVLLRCRCFIQLVLCGFFMVGCFTYMQMFYTVGVVWIFYEQTFYLDADVLYSWCCGDFS